MGFFFPGTTADELLAEADRLNDTEALKRREHEEALLIYQRDTDASDGRWKFVAADTSHIWYYADLESISANGPVVTAWIKSVEPSGDARTPFQVSFSCTGNSIFSGWQYVPGSLAEDVLRWVQRSPWCGGEFKKAPFKFEVTNPQHEKGEVAFDRFPTVDDIKYAGSHCQPGETPSGIPYRCTRSDTSSSR